MLTTSLWEQSMTHSFDTHCGASLITFALFPRVPLSFLFVIPLFEFIVLHCLILVSLWILCKCNHYVCFHQLLVKNFKIHLCRLVKPHFINFYYCITLFFWIVWIPQSINLPVNGYLNCLIFICSRKICVEG